MEVGEGVPLKTIGGGATPVAYLTEQMHYILKDVVVAVAAWVSVTPRPFAACHSLTLSPQLSLCSTISQSNVCVLVL